MTDKVPPSPKVGDNNIAVVQAFPTKLFFVQMLTRDIELKDAVLDLLDNCLDGLLRATGGKVVGEKPYENYWARITATPTNFTIEDNCGGISKELAMQSAFKLGRSDLQRDSDLPTVGMYGIGMKRALFKMGRHSRVISKHGDDSYYVDIPSDWLEDDDKWELELVSTEPGPGPDGTTIRVDDLYEHIGAQFAKDHKFLDELNKDISNLFAVIINKGFAVYLNDELISPARLQILVPQDFNDVKDVKKAGIKPYIFRTQLADVDIDLVVGFYREPPSPDEVDDEQVLRRTTDNAGWTVICNDRVVLSRDKSTMTGWGLGNVPKYHTQFIAIAGVVRFSSNNSYNLPLNTTKRGLDTSSPIYFAALNQMMEGLKEFTTFTNRWKGREQEALPAFGNLRVVNATEVIDSIPERAWTAVRGSDAKAQRVRPQLPQPTQANLKRRIVYFRDREEVEALGSYFFDDPNAAPSDVGVRSFDAALETMRSSET